MARRSNRPARRRGGDLVRGGKEKCIQGGVTVGTDQNPVVERARGCTEEEARRKLFNKLLARGAQSLPCAGRQCDGDEICTQFLTIDMTKIQCLPARVEGCQDDVGYLCIYVGRMTTECLCA